jgi:hypothetical protein
MDLSMLADKSKKNADDNAKKFAETNKVAVRVIRKPKSWKP